MVVTFSTDKVEREVTFFTASSTAAVLASPLRLKVLTQNLLLKYSQEVQQVEVNLGSAKNPSQGGELPWFLSCTSCEIQALA